MEPKGAAILLNSRTGNTRNAAQEFFRKLRGRVVETELLLLQVEGRVEPGRIIRMARGGTRILFLNPGPDL